MTAAVVEPHTAAWYDARRKGVAASEIAAVLGISPWESPVSLYWRKVNGWEAEPSAEAEWGTRLEDAIAAKYGDAHPDWYAAPCQVLCVGPESWMLATPDRILYRRLAPGADAVMPAGGVLELKTGRTGDGWGEPNTSQVPVHYRAQVQWQMLCTGAQFAWFAVLIGGSDYREYVVRRDDRDLAVMVEAGRRFMRRLDTGDPPPLDDHRATLATVKRLHPVLDDTTVDVDPAVAAGYLRAVAMRRKAEVLKDRYEARLRAELGRARKATSGGRFVASRSLYTVAEHTVAEHSVDRLNPPREKKP